MARSSPGSTVLIIIILIFTFPIWFSVGAALFGVMAGIVGALIGVVGAVFGLLVAAIALPFKLIFGWGRCDMGFDWHPAVWLLLLVVAAVLIRRK
jgi:hypothetical protein